MVRQVITTCANIQREPDRVCIQLTRGSIIPVALSLQEARDLLEALQIALAPLYA